MQSIRAQCLREPQKYKFSRSEALAEEEIEQEKDGGLDYLDGGSQGQVWRGRNAKKEGAYVMTLHNGKDVSEEIKSLAGAVEEGVNSFKGESVMSGGGQHVKAVYKRFTFDFFKPEHGYMEKIPLSLPKQGAKKKGAGKNSIVAYLLCVGDSLKVDYTIEEEK